MYAHVENGSVTYRGTLPKTWKNISGLHLSEGDYERLKAADPAEADNMLTTMLMNSNPRANPNYIKNMKERVATVQRVITANNQTISTLVAETREIKTLPEKRTWIVGEYDEEKNKWITKGEIQRLRDENERLKNTVMESPQYKLSPDYEEKDTTVIKSGNLIIGGKTYKVNYNAAGEEVGTRTEIQNIILPKFKGTVDDTTGAVVPVDTTGGVVDTIHANQLAFGFTNATCDYDDDPTINCDADKQILPGLRVSGTGIPAGATVDSVNTQGAVTQFELSAATTGGAETNNTLTFTSGFGDLVDITAEANTASVDLEIFIASV